MTSAGNLPPLAWVVAGAMILMALLAQVMAWRLVRRRRLASLLHDVGVSLLTGSILTRGFLAVTVSIDAERAERERLRAEEFAIRQLIATNDRLPGLDISGRDLSFMYARAKDFSEAEMLGADLSHADLSDSVLTDATLAYAELVGTDLSHADLTRADLTPAQLAIADLRGATLTDATLDGVDFTMDGEFSVPSICYDVTTVWPAGYQPPELRTTCDVIDERTGR